MLTNNTTVNFNIQDLDLGFYGLTILLPVAALSIILNTGVLICLIRRKISFSNYGYWFQLVVLASVDVCNGFVSACLSFVTTELFATNYIACSVLVCLFVCSQINTLCTTCSICINRYLGLKNLKAIETKSSFHKKLSVISASAISCLYCAGPFFIWDVRKGHMEYCQSAYLFGVNERYYKIYICVGIFIPWLITNILYGICVMKLRRASATIRPAQGEKTSSHIFS